MVDALFFVVDASCQADLQAALSQALRECKTAPPELGPIAARFDHVIAEHGSLDRYLEMAWGGRRLEFCLLLDRNFPPLPDLNYDLTPAVGKVTLRPWQLGWDVRLGNKGLLIAEDSKTLVSLIVLQGSITQLRGLSNLMMVELMMVECCVHDADACPLPVLALSPSPCTCLWTVIFLYFIDRLPDRR